MILPKYCGEWEVHEGVIFICPYCKNVKLVITDECECCDHVMLPRNNKKSLSYIITFCYGDSRREVFELLLTETEYDQIKSMTVSGEDARKLRTFMHGILHSKIVDMHVGVDLRFSDCWDEVICSIEGK